MSRPRRAGSLPALALTVTAAAASLAGCSSALTATSNSSGAASSPNASSLFDNVTVSNGGGQAHRIDVDFPPMADASGTTCVATGSGS